MASPAPISIPAHLKPVDGRFGSGPSRIPSDHLAALATGRWAPVMGTSHRQAPVRDLVGQIRSGLRDLFELPEGYEVVLGNGGTNAFWDVAVCCLVSDRAAHAVAGEFGNTFAQESVHAPFLADPLIVTAPAGQAAVLSATDDVDCYAWAHNETSTGVLTPAVRVPGASDSQLMLVDATSIAGAAVVDVSQLDAYYFAPQKAFASEGGLWVALCSPRAIERALRLEATDRWIPRFLSLRLALENSVKNQTLNTPALATLALFAEQVEWLAANGGLAWAEQRCRRSAGVLWQWAASRDFASPFVAEEAIRSPVVTTIDFADSIDAAVVAATLRANGIVDVEPYRKLGRNQLRVAAFPATDPADVLALTECLDFVIEHL